VLAAGMNHLDLWVRRGLPIDIPMPHIGGSDVCAEVVALGAGVEGVDVGARFVVNPSLWCGRARRARDDGRDAVFRVRGWPVRS
jgi:alcohol dehydrogenase